MSKNKNKNWNDISVLPDSGRQILVTDGQNVEVGHFYERNKQFLSADLNKIKYWMDMPTPPESQDSSKNAYLFYKACRCLVSTFKDTELDSLSLGFLEHAEVMLRVYDNVYSKFYSDWMKDKASYKSGYLESSGIVSVTSGNGVNKSWMDQND